MLRPVVTCAVLTALVVGVFAVPASAQSGFKRCRAVAGVTMLRIGPTSRPCSIARDVARAWSRKLRCDPSGRSARNCTLFLRRPWGCEAQAFGFDPNSSKPYYVRCTRNFWHPMSGKPITAMVTFNW